MVSLLTGSNILNKQVEPAVFRNS